MNGNLIVGLIACGVIIVAAVALKLIDWVRNAPDLERVLDLDGPELPGDDLVVLDRPGLAHDPGWDEVPAPGTGPRRAAGWDL